MYYCGRGALAHELLRGITDTEGGLLALGRAPAFALPGDKPVYAPDRPADVRHVEIDVTLDFAAEAVRGIVTTHYSALFDHVGEVTLDATELAIEQVTMAGKKSPLAYWMEGEKLRIQLDRDYEYGQQFAVAVRYSAHPRNGLVFVHPMEGNPDLPTQAWTQGQTEYHHYWFPCHDFPNDRATTALKATVPGAFFALSNGKLEGVSEHPDGTKTYAWRQEFPHPTYLITLVAGEFTELPDHWRDVPVNYYVRPGREADGQRMLDKTPRMIELFSSKTGVDYPYVKYAQIVPEMFLGAMENTSATTHSYRLMPDERASLDWSPDDVVAHELAHQWFGDLLTCRDWGHIWLNESFATFMEEVWTAHDKGEEEAQTHFRQNLNLYLEADKRGRRPIVFNVYHKYGGELFDRHVYEKGSLVLNMLRFTLGEDAFWRAIHLYLERNRGREVITADLERAIEDASGRSMSRFFEQWVYKAGHPQFSVSYSWDDEHHLAKISVQQTQEVTDLTPLFTTPVEIAFMVPDASDTRRKNPKAALRAFRVMIEEAQQTFYFPLERRPLSVRFDQGGWLIKTLDFKRPSELLRYQLTHDPDALGRIEAAEALGALADEASLTALEEALISEPFWSVTGAIATALGNQRTERALDALIGALDKVTEPRARRIIVAALGNFHAPEQQELATRAAQALTDLLRRGEPSYFVEAAALTALGRARTPGAFELLTPLLDRSSWNEVIRGAVFTGLGELGDPRAVDLMTSWLLDHSKPMDARAAAAGGLGTLARTKLIDPGEAQTQAVNALIAALDDSWELTQMGAIAALGDWGDARAIPALERLMSITTEDRMVRACRQVILRLQRGRSANEETRTLRSDLEQVREANRALRDRLEALETRLNSAHGANERHSANGAVRAAKGESAGKRSHKKR
jgi:aminopeptidase N